MNRSVYPPCFAAAADALSQAFVTLGSGIAACVSLVVAHHVLGIGTEKRIAEVRAVARALLDRA